MRSQRLLTSISRAVPQSQRPCRVQSIARRWVATHTDAQYESALSVLQSSADTGSPEFKENARQFAVLNDHFKALHEKIILGGPEKARKKHLERGKMLPRDRVSALLDPGSAFLELSPLAGTDMYPGEDVPAGGIITGIGKVSGVECMIVANDST